MAFILLDHNMCEKIEVYERNMCGYESFYVSYERKFYRYEQLPQSYEQNSLKWN